MDTKRAQRLQKGASRRQQIKESIESEHITIYKGTRLTFIWPQDYEELRIHPDHIELMDLGWRTPTHFEECKLCEAAVSAGFMWDHLEHLCPEQRVECALCKERVPRKQQMDHWKDGDLCSGYTLHCMCCGTTFDSKSKLRRHQHQRAFPHFGAETKASWMFNVDDETRFKEEQCREDAAVSRWVCIECGHRCDRGLEQLTHECPQYKRDRDGEHEFEDRVVPQWMVQRVSVEHKVASYAVEHMLRVQLQMAVPMEIRGVILGFLTDAVFKKSPHFWVKLGMVGIRHFNVERLWLSAM